MAVGNMPVRIMRELTEDDIYKLSLGLTRDTNYAQGLFAIYGKSLGRCGRASLPSSTQSIAVLDIARIDTMISAVKLCGADSSIEAFINGVPLDDVLLMIPTLDEFLQAEHFTLPGTSRKLHDSKGNLVGVRIGTHKYHLDDPKLAERLRFTD